MLVNPYWIQWRFAWKRRQSLTPQCHILPKNYYFYYFPYTCSFFFWSSTRIAYQSCNKYRACLGARKCNTLFTVHSLTQTPGKARRWKSTFKTTGDLLFLEQVFHGHRAAPVFFLSSFLLERAMNRKSLSGKKSRALPHHLFGQSYQKYRVIFFLFQLHVKAWRKVLLEEGTQT